jgi:hypothetical protein
MTPADMLQRHTRSVAAPHDGHGTGSAIQIGS